MTRIIEISDEDLKAIYNTSMTIEEMDSTLRGRVYSAICRGCNAEKEVKEVIDDYIAKTNKMDFKDYTVEVLIDKLYRIQKLIDDWESLKQQNMCADSNTYLKDIRNIVRTESI